MKKSIVLIGTILVSFSTFAQHEKLDPNTVTISANYSFSDPSLYGISAEFGNSDFFLFDEYTSTLLNISASQLNYDNNLVKVKGNGYTIELGKRVYQKRGRKSGVYLQWLIAYSSTNFNENTPLGNFEGNYSYWSLINHDIGYKIKIGKNIILDPSIGFNWKWEVKGKGDIDNTYVDNFVFRCGVKLGFSF
ncbi:hypothetical protein [Flavobacterium taihuense]|uniref:DUF3575 domain-containing protein n=1 Tax=Flavobacterium taihuense TaxID=2857508 RepID=A0ABS6XSM4_9FLAO|nr:hypothetical protein [Flavobacterium taihuense]MBW4359665.1 hypothetical protein [Flavobacterium taihuense]